MPLLNFLILLAFFVLMPLIPFLIVYFYKISREKKLKSPSERAKYRSVADMMIMKYAVKEGNIFKNGSLEKILKETEIKTQLC